MFPPSLFGMETTACRKQHVQEIYSGTKNQLGYLQAVRRTYRTSPLSKVKVQSRDKARSYSYNIKTSRSIKCAKRNNDTDTKT